MAVAPTGIPSARSEVSAPRVEPSRRTVADALRPTAIPASPVNPSGTSPRLPFSTTLMDFLTLDRIMVRPVLPVYSAMRAQGLHDARVLRRGRGR
jgi:hypothetical protein